MSDSGYFTQKQQIDLGENRHLSYWCELRPKSAKYQIKLIIHPQKGLIVRQAADVSLAQVQRFLLSHQQWILKTGQKPKPSTPAFSLTDFSLTIQGEKLPVTFYPKPQQQIKISRQENSIHIILPTTHLTVLENPVHPEHNQTIDLLQKSIENWYKNQAHLLLPRLLHECARACPWVKKDPPLRIKIQKTRWGSCSGKGNINLNASLLQFDNKIIKSVILHELCHLQQMNHSPDFYRLLASVDPDWQSHRLILKKACAQLFA